MIQLPSPAIDHYNKLGARARAALCPLAPDKLGSGKLSGSLAELHIVAHLDAAEVTSVGPYIEQELDRTLRQVRMRTHDGPRSLTPEGIEIVNKMVSQLAGRAEVAPYASPRFLLDLTLAWLQAAVSCDWYAAFRAACDRDVVERTVYVPIEGLAIQRAFPLGRIGLEYLGKSDVDAMLELASRHADAELLAYKETEWRRTLQGTVVARFSCVAEPEVAYRMAARETDQALDLLRFYHPAALSSQRTCYVGRRGQVSPAAEHFLERIEGRPMPTRESGDPEKLVPFIVDEAALREIGRIGLADLHEILKGRDTITEFERTLLDAVVVYARGVVSPSPQNRLLHALVAAETLFLRNDNEPILGNLTRRLAVVAAPDVNTRKLLIEEFKAAYNLRSKFVHHGIELVKPEVIDRALQHIVTAIIMLCRQRARFKTKDEMIEHLESELLG